MIEPYKKGHDLSIMIWASFWGGGRSNVVLMERDSEAKKKGYSSRSYLAVLEDQIPRCWEPGRIFMQDNAPIHNAKIVKEYFENMAIPVLEWPPYTSDLNPIEHLWHALKCWIRENHPELEGM